MATRVTGPGVEDMRKLAVIMRTADPRLRRNMAKRLREAVRPAMEAAQAAVMEMGGKQDEGLRREVQKTVYTAVSTTKTEVRVTIVSLGSRMPAGKQNLPKHINEPGGWAHPVFATGPRSGWHWINAHQIGRPHWFEQPIADHAPQIRNAVMAALEETAQELAGPLT